jgi:hypothetical protein
MPDIRDRFRSLDNQGAPDLWNEASALSRAASPQPSWLPRIGGALAVGVVLVLAVVVGLQLAGGGPLIGGDPAPSAEPSPSSEPTDSAEPSPSVEPSTSVEPSAGPSGPEPAFTCGQPIQLAAQGSELHPLLIADIRLGTHDGYDRIVFEFVDDGTPELQLDDARTPYVQNPSGMPLEVDGSPVYSVTLIGATKHDMETGEEPYQGSTDFTPGFAQIAEFVESGDFEAVNGWYLGTNGSTCLRAFILADPSRLVIDIEH